MPDPLPSRALAAPRWLLAGLGTACVGLGALGVFLPGLPATVFLLAACWCFARSCPWLEERLVRVPLFAPFLGFLEPGARVPRKMLAKALVIMWLAIIVSAAAVGLGDDGRPGVAAAVTRPGPPNPVASFSFEPDGLLLRAEEVALFDYGTAGIAVLFTPRPNEGREPLPPASLDLYILTEAAAPRWTIVQGVTGFGVMGGRQSASFGANVRAFAAEVEQRLPAVPVDRRLMKMQVRRRGGAAPAGVPVRQGYSFATASLTPPGFELPSPAKPQRWPALQSQNSR